LTARTPQRRQGSGRERAIGSDGLANLDLYGKSEGDHLSTGIGRIVCDVKLPKQGRGRCAFLGNCSMSSRQSQAEG
jgi:hypothetical protein